MSRSRIKQMKNECRVYTSATREWNQKGPEKANNPADNKAGPIKRDRSSSG